MIIRDNMSNKVYSLYQNNKYSNLDNNYIYNIFDEMIAKEPELMPYVNDFIITEEPGMALGVYSNEDRHIKINKELIEKQECNSQLLTIEVIRHELEHARNLKTLYEGRDDIESTIVGYSLRHFAMAHNIDKNPNLDNLDELFIAINTRLNYEIDPGERLAEIKAWKYIVNLLKNQRTSMDLLIARSMLYYSYIRGYNDNGYYLYSPTYEFLLKTGMLHDHYWLKNRVNKNDYCFNTRITYGLPITYPEYEKKVLSKVKLQKREWIINREDEYYE